MIYKLESSKLSVEVNDIGIELSSIQSLSTGIEYLWQGNPAIWSGQAPVLFPIIGALKGGFTFINGQKHSIPKHGIIRNSSKPTLKSKTASSLLFSLKWDEESLLLYPFKFELEIEFILKGKTLTIKHTITNHGEETMLYSIGGHPAFNCPLRDSEEYEDYFLEFAQPETDSTWMVEETGLIGLKQKKVLDNTAILPLHKHLFDDDALIFKHLKSKEVMLKHKDRGSILSVNFDDFDYLGIWAKPGAPFVCIEPWLGIADSVDSNQKFEEKEGLLKLEPDQSDVKIYSITIEQ
ncbi:aldose 1-epimerase family protein [Algoriphagus sp. D3-2-R+10]|uniref:aldose 1-epimerase family protein n=1 Tax=Algoriphagus aurantiacus TaxID=3103948 RepID=UPI002B36DAA1|nr:aldose 1-epimerase family protein [Algoriphagus sp. D3-2-R+10]MEB2775765.1 aldose 1-epimerase family protein [Algoriphagus sp. D3-2-R+10]